ncbi:PIN-like domain-containing protein [Hymenobacter rubripertinctus]|uniref:VapC45 PIN like domain-containing protein n=1 Tax=Hymenobacter rubripertinctus TaxID=2029981 RepID=A0A418QR38_9BACT|nr:hypothetical protein [Hymenobacter rubripertinctus]RIY07737.1 hypothetical protein D0T11_15915 [Hymenobacter rubripertinctus]
MSSAPDPLFFLDRTLDTTLVRAALQALPDTFLHHADLFAPATPDAEWLPAVTARGGFVLTQERRLHYNPLELEALLASGSGTFILVAKGLTGAGVAECLVRALPRLRRFVQKYPRPFVAKVYVDGSVQRVLAGT